MATTLNISEPQHTYTLNQFIQLKDGDKITYQNYSILERSLSNRNLIYAIDNLLYTYMEEINKKRKKVIVSEDDKIKYAYKPKLLSYDIYGSIEVYFVLLAMNGMCNLKEFDLADNFFYALYPSDLSYMVASIKNAERQHINMNRNSLQIYQ